MKSKKQIIIKEKTPFTLIISDELEIKRAIRAIDMLSLLWDLQEHLKEICKYDMNEKDNAE